MTNNKLNTNWTVWDAGKDSALLSVSKGGSSANIYIKYMIKMGWWAFNMHYFVFGFAALSLPLIPTEFI